MYDHVAIMVQVRVQGGEKEVSAEKLSDTR